MLALLIITYDMPLYKDNNKLFDIVVFASLMLTLVVLLVWKYIFEFVYTVKYISQYALLQFILNDIYVNEVPPPFLVI